MRLLRSLWSLAMTGEQLLHYLFYTSLLNYKSAYQSSGDEPLSLSVLLLPPEEIGDVPVSPDGIDGPEPGKVLPEEIGGNVGADELLLSPITESFLTVFELTLAAIAADIRS